MSSYVQSLDPHHLDKTPFLIERHIDRAPHRAEPGDCIRHIRQRVALGCRVIVRRGIAMLRHNADDLERNPAIRARHGARGTVLEAIFALGEAVADAHALQDARQAADGDVVAVDLQARHEVHGHFVFRGQGIGIPESAKQSIFDAFEQADSSATRRFAS